MKKFLSLILLMFLVINISFSQDLTPNGPYILFEDNGYRVVAVDKSGNISDESFNKKFKKEKIEVYSSDKKHLFNVTVKPNYPKTPAVINNDGKIFVITDPHSEFESFMQTLVYNGVMNDKFEWTYGKNNLVVVGDIFDRGDDATTILWLVYKLEEEAKKDGGNVIFTIGNHEDMILKGDDRYMNDKYEEFADKLDIEHKELYSKDSFFGKWIRNKNIIQQLNGYIFVHAGLSQEFLDRGLSFDEVNSTVEKWLGTSTDAKEAVGGDIEFIYRTYGPIWYRGMAHSKEKYKPISQESVEEILKQHNAKKIILGHTIFDDITERYNGKVLMVNMKHIKNRLEGRATGIEIDEDKIFRVYADKPATKM